MKKILFTATAILFVGSLLAQMDKGRVNYSRTMQMQVRLSGAAEEFQNMLPRSRTDNFELHFGNNQSLWRQAEREMEDETINTGGGMQFRMVVSGMDDMVFTDFAKARRVEQREIMDKKFIIDDSIRPMKWKMTGENKTILGQNCMKATATLYSKRMQTVMTDGNMERKEVSDTSLVTAWFAPGIPVSAGPGEYQGQLPGLILELRVGDDRLVYTTTEISPDVNLDIIKAPSGKKRYTQEEFNKEREKMMEEMQRNNGGRRMIRMQ